MDNSLRNEVLRLLSLHMDVTSPGGVGIDKAFPGPEKQNISHMTLTEARQAGITMYGDASFSIDTYMGSFPSFAHFVTTVIVHETRGAQSLPGVELEQIEPCRILATGNEQLYAINCNGSYATLFLQTS
ncbi:hypothetical protein [Myxococcus sp. CA039A]|uniref:hypothetical protein n=1 Tax=Myxococcus sp. CA039A TaxID=2741737 RepID=UPI00157A7199|nr:hypothetical protein [Myxococcus sp. CA039A]NTX55477.1 hypothetical protein [Myxococcus sp. CA039A]